MAKSHGQADEFGMDHSQLHENQTDVQKLRENFNEKCCQKHNSRKTMAYEKQGLTVQINFYINCGEMVDPGKI